MDAAGASSAPIGDLSVQVVNARCGSGGKGFRIFLALTVAMAVFGSTLAAMNTAVRFSQAMAEDGELPQVFCTMSAKNTPYMGIAIKMCVTFTIGSIGACGGGLTLLAVTLASNLGTFVLYTFVCVVTIVAFKNSAGEKPLLQLYMPVLGIFLNLLMVGSIFIIGLISGGDTTLATVIAICLAVLWTALILPYWMLKGPGPSNSKVHDLSVVPGEPRDLK
jgi:amino acid transporter